VSAGIRSLQLEGHPLVRPVAPREQLVSVHGRWWNYALGGATPGEACSSPLRGLSIRH
jgi:hypothetical protein